MKLLVSVYNSPIVIIEHLKENNSEYCVLSKDEILETLNTSILIVNSYDDFKNNIKFLNSYNDRPLTVILFTATTKLLNINNYLCLDFYMEEEVNIINFVEKPIDYKRILSNHVYTTPVALEDMDFLTFLINKIRSNSLLNYLMTFLYKFNTVLHKSLKQIIITWIVQDGRNLTNLKNNLLSVFSSPKKKEEFLEYYSQLRKIIRNKGYFCMVVFDEIRRHKSFSLSDPTKVPLDNRYIESKGIDPFEVHYILSVYKNFMIGESDTV